MDEHETKQYILRVLLKSGITRGFYMLDGDALDSALSQWLDEYPRPMTIALELACEDGCAKFADVDTSDIFALEYVRPMTEGMRAYRIANGTEIEDSDVNL